MRVSHDEGSSTFLAQLERFLDVVSGLGDEQLLAASRCRGWTAGDLLVHVHLGLQDVLLGLLDPTDSPPDVDAATYWRAEVPRSDPDADALAGVRFVRLLGAAYRRPSGVVGQLRPTVLGVARAVRACDPGAVRFQGHVIATGDFLATWAVELAVHQLDLGPDTPPPDAGALRMARTTIESLAGAFPSAWSDEVVVLAGTGRVGLGPAERREVGEVAGRLPAFG
jgi:hypothetical protein